MATSYTLSLLLNAVDKASAPIKAVVTTLGDLGKAAQQAMTSTKQIGDQGTSSMDRFRASIQQAKDNMEGLNKAAAEITKVSGELLMIGASLSATFLFPVMQAAAFQLAMAKVKAVSEATVDEYKALAEEAHRLGIATKFTATQVAEGMGELAQAGLKANQIIAAMPPIIALATAGMLSLAEATDITVSVMFGMGLAVNDLQHVTDVLARTAVDTNVSVHELGESMKFVASAASAAGMPIEEVAAAIGVLGNVGIKASMAGTVVRGMITKLADPTKEAKDKFAELGIEINSADGKMRSFTNIVSDLAKSNMSLADASKIFDIRAATGALALTKNIDKLKELTRANEESYGSTARMAATIGDTISGAWINFKATIEAVSTALVGPMAGGIKIVIDGLNVLLQTFVKIIEVLGPFSQIVFGLVGFFGALLVTVGTLGFAMSGLIKVFGLLVPLMEGIALAGIASSLQISSLGMVFTMIRAIAIELVVALRLLTIALFTTVPGVIALAAGLVFWSESSKSAAEAANALAASATKSREAFDGMFKTLVTLTPGTMQHKEALLALIRAYPELASQIRLTNQAWAEQEEILRKQQAALKIKEMGVLGGALAANAATVATGPADKMSIERELLNTAKAFGTFFTGVMQADIRKGTTGYIKAWNAATDGVLAYRALKLHESDVQFQVSLVLMTNQFRQLGEAMGLAPEQFIKLTKEQLEEMYKSNEHGMDVFRANWILAKGDQDSYVVAAIAAQKKIRDAMLTPEGTPATPVQKMVTEAIAAVNTMAGLTREQKSQITSVMAVMESELEKQPVSVQMAWLAMIKKVVAEFATIPNKTAGVIEFLRNALLGVNISTIQGLLPGIGPTMPPMSGPDALKYTPGTDTSSIRRKTSEQLFNLITSVVEETSKKLGIDPRISYAIMGHESNFVPGAFNPEGGNLGASGLGQFRAPTAVSTLAGMGKPGLTQEEAKALAFDPKIASEMIPTHIRQLVTALEAAGQEVSLWNILWRYRGGADIPMETFQRYYNDITSRMAGFQKGAGGVEFYTLEKLKIEKARIDDLMATAKSLEAKQLAGTASTLEKTSALTIQKGALVQQELRAQLEIAVRAADTTKMATLGTQMALEKAVTSQALKELGIQEVALARENAAAVRAVDIDTAEWKIKLAEMASKRQESIWALEKAQQGARFADQKISAMEYYSSITKITDSEWEAEKAALQVKIDAEKEVWKQKRESALKAVEFLDATKQEVTLQAVLLAEQKAMQPLLEEKIVLENKHNALLAQKGETLAKQKKDTMETGLYEMEWANALGPIAEQAAKIEKLRYEQSKQRLKDEAESAAQLASYTESKGVYGMSPEELGAWNLRREAAREIQMRNIQFGEEAKRWAGIVTSGVSSLVDSLMDGSTDIRKAMNTFFKSMFKGALEPAFKQLTQLLQDGFTSAFSGIASWVGGGKSAIAKLIAPPLSKTAQDTAAGVTQAIGIQIGQIATATAQTAINTSGGMGGGAGRVTFPQGTTIPGMGGLGGKIGEFFEKDMLGAMDIGGGFYEDLATAGADAGEEFSNAAQAGMESGAESSGGIFNSIFSSIFSGLKSLFGGGGGAGGAAGGLNIGNTIMGAIGILGMMLSKSTSKSWSPSGVESGVTGREAVRGVIAGETSIPIAQISVSIREAFLQSERYLKEIAENTSGGVNSGGGGGGTGKTDITVNVNIPNLRTALEEFMTQYFAKNMMQGGLA